jgi:ribosomal protein S18 acetylase RimI-like enzyme
VTHRTPAVRLATSSDAAAIADAHIRGWRAAYRGLVPDRILDGFDAARRTAWWADRIAAQSDGEAAEQRTWVVLAGDAVAGFAASGPAGVEAAPPPTGAGEVFAIYLAPEQLRRGLGRRLFAKAIDDLQARRFAPIVVWVFEANDRARRFYEAAGFVPDGARHVVRFDGVEIAEIRYRLGAPDAPAARPDKRTRRDPDPRTGPTVARPSAS